MTDADSGLLPPALDNNLSTPVSRSEASSPEPESEEERLSGSADDLEKKLKELARQRDDLLNKYTDTHNFLEQFCDLSLKLGVYFRFLNNSRVTSNQKPIISDDEVDEILRGENLIGLKERVEEIESELKKKLSEQTTGDQEDQQRPVQEAEKAQLLENYIEQARDELHQLMRGADGKLRLHRDLLNIEANIQKSQRTLLHMLDESINDLKNNGKRDEAEHQEQHKATILSDQLIAGATVYKKMREGELALAKAIASGKWEKQRQGNKCKALCSADDITVSENNPSTLIEEVERWLSIRALLESQYADANFIAEELRLNQAAKRNQLNESLLSTEQLESIRQAESLANIDEKKEQRFRIIQYLYSPSFPPSLREILDKLRALNRKILLEKIGNLQKGSAKEAEAEKQSIQSALYNQILAEQKQTEQEMEQINSTIDETTRTAEYAQTILSTVLDSDKHSRKPIDERERIKLRANIKKLSSLELQSLSILRRFDDEMMRPDSVWSNRDIRDWNSYIDDLSKKKIRDGKNRTRNLEARIKDLEEDKEKLLSTVTEEALLIEWRSWEIKKLMIGTEETQPLVVKSNLEIVSEKLSRLSDIEKERQRLLPANKKQWELIYDQLALQNAVFGQMARQKIFQKRLIEVKTRIDEETARASTTKAYGSTAQEGGAELTGTTLVPSGSDNLISDTGENRPELEIVEELTKLHESLSDDLKEIQDRLAQTLDPKALTALRDSDALLASKLSSFETRLFDLENEHLPKVWQTDIEKAKALYDEVIYIDPLLEAAAEQYVDFTRLYLASRVRLEQFMEDVIAQRNAFVALPEEAKMLFEVAQDIGTLVNQYPQFVKLVIEITKITQPEWTNVEIVELLKDWQTKELKILDNLRTSSSLLRNDESANTRWNSIRLLWHRLGTRMDTRLFGQFDLSMQDLIRVVEQIEVTSSQEAGQNNSFIEALRKVCASWSNPDTKTIMSEFHQFSMELDRLFNDWRENELLIDSELITEKLGKVLECWLRREPMMRASVLDLFNEQVNALKTYYQSRAVLIPTTSETHLNWLATFRNLWADRVRLLEGSVFTELIDNANAVNIAEFPPELSDVIMHLKAAQTSWSRGRVDNAVTQCERQLIASAQEFKAYQESISDPRVEITEVFFETQVMQAFEESMSDPRGNVREKTNDDTALRRLVDARKLDYERRKAKIEKLEPLLDVLDSWAEFGDSSVSNLRRALSTANAERVGDTTIAQQSTFAIEIETRLQEGRAYLNQPVHRRLIADYKLNIEERLKSEEQKSQMQSTHSQYLFDQIISLNRNHLQAVQGQINGVRFDLTDTWYFEMLDAAIVRHWTKLRQREKRYGITDTQEQDKKQLTGEGSDYLTETSDSLKNALESQLNRRLESEYYDEAYWEEIENLRRAFQALPEKSARRRARAMNFSPEKTERYVEARLRDEEPSIQRKIDEVNMSSTSQNADIFTKAIQRRVREKLRSMKATAEYKERLNEMMIGYLAHFQNAIDLSMNAGVPFPLHNEICKLLTVQATHEQYRLISSEITRLVREHFFPIGGLSLSRKLAQLQDRQSPDQTHFTDAKQKVENLVLELNARIAADASDISGFSGTPFIQSEAIRNEVEANPEEAKRYLKRANDLLDEVDALIKNEEEKVRGEVKEIETLAGQDTQFSALLAGLQALPDNDHWLSIITSTLTDEQSKSLVSLRREVESAKSGLEDGQSSYLSRELQILSGFLREQEDNLEKIKGEIVSVASIDVGMVKRLLEERAKWDSRHQQAKAQMQKMAKYMRLIAVEGVQQERLQILNGDTFKAFREKPLNERFSKLHDELAKLLLEAQKHIQGIETGYTALSVESEVREDTSHSSSKQLAEGDKGKTKEVAGKDEAKPAQSPTELVSQFRERLKRKAEERRAMLPLEPWLEARNDAENQRHQQEIDDLSKLSIHESLRREVLQASSMVDIVERCSPLGKEASLINVCKTSISDIKAQLIKLEKSPNEKKIKSLLKVVSNITNLILKTPFEAVIRHQEDLYKQKRRLVEDDRRRINEIRGSLARPEAPSGWQTILELPLNVLDASLAKQDELLKKLEDIKVNVIASRDNPKEWLSACKDFEDQCGALDRNRKEQRIESEIITLENMLDIPQELEIAITRLENEKDNLMSENQKLKGVIRNVQNMNTTLKGSLGERDDELDGQINVSNNLLNVNTLLQNCFTHLRRLHGALTNTHGQALRRIRELSNETSELNRKLESTSDFEAQQRAEIASIKTELEDITKEFRRVLQQTSDMEKRFVAEVKAHANTQNDLKTLREQHEATSHALITETLANLQKRHDDLVSQGGLANPQFFQSSDMIEDSHKTGHEITPTLDLFESYVRETKKKRRKNLFKGLTKDVPGDVEVAIDAYKKTHSDTQNFEELKLGNGGGRREVIPVIRSPGFLIATVINPLTSKPAFLVLKDIDFSRVQEHNAKDHLGNHLHAPITLTFNALKQKKSQESTRGRGKKAVGFGGKSN